MSRGGDEFRLVPNFCCEEPREARELSAAGSALVSSAWLRRLAATNFYPFGGGQSREDFRGAQAASLQLPAACRQQPLHILFRLKPMQRV